MNGTQQYANPVNGASQFDPQGLLGSLLGGVAGRVVGKAVGGSTGQEIGGWGGRIAGGFLPFEAGPAAEQPSDLELMGFWSVLKKIGQGAGTAVNLGKQLGVLDAGVPNAGMSNAGMSSAGMSSAGASGATAQAPSDLELMGFWSVLKKIGQGVSTGVEVGKRVGLFDAGTPGAGAQGAATQAAPAPSDLELMGFWSVLKKIGQGVGTGLNVGKQLGVFESTPTGQNTNVASQEQSATAIIQQALPALQALAQAQGAR